jgi:hypothetical protein
MNIPVPTSHFSSSVAIALDDLIARYPTLGATEPHYSRSDVFGYVDTRGILETLYSEGFRVFSVSTARPRDVSKRGYEKHMLRLRHVDAPIINGASPEIVLKNAHDGTSRYEALGGLIRFICSNGLVIGEMIERIAIKHVGDISGRVVDATHRIAHQVSDVIPVIDAMRAIDLTQERREAFAEAAHAIRFEPNENGETRAPVSPLALLTPRRAEDTNIDLWSTFNVVQENLVRGGLQGRTIGSNGRMRRSTLREIRGIDGNIDVNRRLFDLAHETYRDLVAA